MSLNNIHLQTSLLADLYKNSLIEITATGVSQTKQVKYLGNNKKNTIVVVSHQSVPYLTDEELSFLTTVLAACKLGIADVAIINQSHIQVTELQNIINSEAKNVLLFGVEPLSIGLPINFPAFQLQAFNNRTYLHAPQLSIIEADKTLKTRLWTSLKAMFRI